MQLIRISADGVQIKSDLAQVGNLSIHDMIQVGDRGASQSLICMVTDITKQEEPERFDLDGEILEPEVNGTINCSIIGSLVDGKFRQAIENYPTTQVEVNSVSRELFQSMLTEQDRSSLKIGTYAGYGCAAYINANRLFQRHSAILGNTGSGKSVTVAKILEEASRLPGTNVILFDVHGEYSNLSYVKEIKIGEEGMDFPLWFLPFRDMYGNVLKMKEESSTVQLTALRKAYHYARKNEKNEELPLQYSLEDLIAYLERENAIEIDTGEVYKSGAKAGMPKTVKGENNGKLTSMIGLLRDKLRDTKYDFMTREHPQDYLNTFLQEVYSNTGARVKVINLSEVPYEMIPIIVAVIAKLLYRVQLQQEREKIRPMCLVCDEAHGYIPSSDFGLGASQRRLLEVFEKIAKEGRKFGVSLMVASQRPSELNRTIMAQCANYIVMKMSNDTDKQMMKNILPEGSKNILDSVNLFVPGSCFVIGDSTDLIFQIRVDLPSELPSSSTIDTWDCWYKESQIDVDKLVETLLEESR